MKPAAELKTQVGGHFLVAWQVVAITALTTLVSLVLMWPAWSSRFGMGTVLVVLMTTTLGSFVASRFAQVFGARRPWVLAMAWSTLVVVTLLISLYLPLPMAGQYGAMAEWVANGDWTSAGITPINFPGTAWIYGALLAVAGPIPPVASLINSLLSLVSVTYIAGTCFQLMPNLGRVKWTILALMLVPSQVIFNADIGKESLNSFAVVIAAVTIGRCFAGLDEGHFLRTVCLLSGASLLLALVRPTGLIMLPLSVIALIVFLRNRPGFSYPRGLLLLAIPSVAFPIGVAVNQSLGGLSQIDVYAKSALSGSLVETLNTSLTWESGSIGQLLLPVGPLGVALTAVPRTLLYLVAPLGSRIPVEYFSPSLTREGMDYLSAVLTSALILLAAVGLVASVLTSFKPAHRQSAMFWIPAFIGLLVVGAGTVLIYVRYRIPVELLLFTAAWLGYVGSSRRTIIRSAIGVSTCAAIGVVILTVLRLAVD